MQAILSNARSKASMLVQSQLFTMKSTLNIPLLAGYTYYFPKQLFFSHFVNAINSYASFTTADEDYWNVLLVTLLWKITNGWYPSPATKKEKRIRKSSRNVIFVFIILNNCLPTYTLIKSESTFSKQYMLNADFIIL